MRIYKKLRLRVARKKLVKAEADLKNYRKYYAWGGQEQLYEQASRDIEYWEDYIDGLVKG